MQTTVVTTETHQDLLNAVIAFGEAWARSDAEAVDAAMVIDYAHTDSFGDVYTREQYISYVAHPRHIDHIGFEDVVIRSHGCCAVVTGKNVVVRTTDEGPSTSCIRFTQVWVLDGETWKRAAFHACEIDAD